MRPMNLTDLPPVPSSIQTDYIALIQEVDAQVAALSSLHRSHLRCAPGCSTCCRNFSVSPIEAALIGEQLGLAPMGPSSKTTGDTCRFLIDDLCSIYVYRPLICRTQGLPIGYIDEINERIDVSVCPLNFSADYQFTHEDLLFLDPFNRLLSELSSNYCRETGIDAKSRISLG